jgi:hypothetical protein
MSDKSLRNWLVWLPIRLLGILALALIVAILLWPIIDRIGIISEIIIYLVILGLVVGFTWAVSFRFPLLRKRSKVLRFLVSFGLSVVLLSVTLVVTILVVSSNMGFSAAHIKDYDLVLTAKAREVLPLIREADSHIAKYGEAPSVMDTSNYKTEVVYIRRFDNHKSRYDIYIKLGIDSNLIYESIDKRWYIDPGDGSDGKTVRLNP